MGRKGRNVNVCVLYESNGFLSVGRKDLPTTNVSPHTYLPCNLRQRLLTPLHNIEAFRDTGDRLCYFYLPGPKDWQLVGFMV